MLIREVTSKMCLMGLKMFDVLRRGNVYDKKLQIYKVTDYRKIVKNLKQSLKMSFLSN